MKYLFIVWLLTIGVFAQSIEMRSGIITYISTQNVYVKFENTTGIESSDTLYIKQKQEYVPALSVRFISSRSCAGEIINKILLNISDTLTAFIYLKEQEFAAYKDTSIIVPIILQKEGSTNPTIATTLSKEKYNGRLSVQSYSTFSNTGTKYDVQRWKYNLSFNGENISNTPISFISYLNFSYRTHEWNDVQKNPEQYTRIYDLALSYKSNDFNAWLGRFLNPRISSISSIDGLQIEKRLSEFYVGGVAGSRPDFSSMGYNYKLFEAGIYAGRTDTLDKGIMENTAAIFQQTNNFVTDRRYLYFQHSNTNLVPKASLFFSSEIDLYQKINDEIKNEFSLTSFLGTLRITPIQEVSLFLSYDNRKNIIYYETFKNFLDSLIENETRQGFRGNINLNIVKNLMISGGMNYGYRKSDLKASRNYNLSATYSAIPYLESSATLTYNYLTSSYLNGKIWSLGLLKYISLLNSDFGINYRNTQYSYNINSEKQTQNAFLIFLSLGITRQIRININYEGIFEEEKTSGRVLIDLSTRL